MTLETRHGGDLTEATRRFGAPREPWLDLSTGVNPRHYPFDPEPLSASLTQLPSSEGLEALLAAARQAYGVAKGVGIAAAPGTEVLIRALSRVISGESVLLDTTYRSYREALGPDLTVRSEFPGLADHPDLSVILINPNNPDGRVRDPTLILKIARGRRAHSIVVIDEAYAEAEPNASVTHSLRADDPVLVLKSFGKFFGLPGLRLGFAVGQPSLVSEIEALVGDWPVSGPAQEIGTAALSDSDWRAETRHWLGNQAQMLDAVLSGAGLRSGGGCRLFRVVDAPDAEGLQRKLAEQGIWTRIFRDRPGLVRFGLPPDRDGLERLGRALGSRWP
jgi:cobalamin biosynthetic protein CobC